MDATPDIINKEPARTRTVIWNPWHGCKKLSPGCLNCYVYRIDQMHQKAEESSTPRKTASYDLPSRRNRDGSPRIAPGTEVWTCFTSDFLLEEADAWRGDCWRMIRERRDLSFIFLTKRITRLKECLPPDWGPRGYANVTIGCTVENQLMARERLPVFRQMPIRRRLIVVEPMLEAVDLSPWLDGLILEVLCGGESGPTARPMNYGWVLELRRQCLEKGIGFHFHQTGSCLVKEGRTYRIPRRFQIQQARKAGIDLPVSSSGDDFCPNEGKT